jgi:predicted membrane chloride channel (bestrophin family)
MMLQWKGSIFQFLWIEFTVAVSVYALVLTVMVFGFERRARWRPAARKRGGLLKLFGFVTGRFQAAISLMLGFYTSTTYTRWWEVRAVEGVVIGRVNDLAAQIAALVHRCING